MQRRDFVKSSSLLSVGALILPGSLFAFPSKTFQKVRIGLIGAGFRGQSHLAELLKRDDVEIIAMADPDPIMMARAQKIVTKAGAPSVTEYSSGDFDYRNFCVRGFVLDHLLLPHPHHHHPYTENNF